MLIKTITVLTKASFLALLLSCSVNAGTYDIAVEAYEARDYKTAFKEFKISADNGDTEAQFQLGYMYELGRGVPQWYKQSIRLYELAADKNNISAQYRLGIMYSSKDSVVQDYITAHMWANIAASNGNSQKLRDNLAKKMSPQQIEEAQQKASEWVAKHNN